MQSENVILASNGAAGNGADVVVAGGRYVVSVQATGIDGTHLVTLQMKNVHGDYLTLGTAFSAIGSQAIDVPPGTVRVLMGAGTSAVYAQMTRLPS